MSLAVFERTLKKIYVHELLHNAQSVSIVFFGGEPLLNWKLIREACFFRKMKRWPIPLHYGLITNGLLLDDAKLRFIHAHDIHLTISYDGSLTNLKRHAASSQDVRAHLESIFQWHRDNKISKKVSLQWCLYEENTSLLLDDLAFLDKQFPTIFLKIMLQPVNHVRKKSYRDMMLKAKKSYPGLIIPYEYEKTYDSFFDSYDIDGQGYAAADELIPFNL